LIQNEDIESTENFFDESTIQQVLPTQVLVTVIDKLVCCSSCM